MQALQSGARVAEAVLAEDVEPCPCCKETDHDLNGCPQFDHAEYAAHLDAAHGEDPHEFEGRFDRFTCTDPSPF